MMIIGIILVWMGGFLVGYGIRGLIEMIDK